MLCPRRGRFLLTAAAGCATWMCACGRLGFEPGHLDAVVEPTGVDAAVKPGDSPDGAALDSASPSTAPHIDAGNSATDACPPGVLICEGFEVSLAGWTFVRSDGSASVILDSRSGMGALLLSTRSNGATAYLERPFGPISSGTLYVRAFIRVDGSTAIDSYHFMVLSNALEGDGVAVSLNDATLSLSGIAGGTTSHGTLFYTRDEWSCVEVSLPLSQATEITVDLNGMRDTGLSADEGLPSGGYARIALGIANASAAQTPTQIAIDDVVVATKPIGCD